MRCFCVGFFHLKTDHPFRHAKKHLPTLRNGLMMVDTSTITVGHQNFLINSLSVSTLFYASASQNWAVLSIYKFGL